MDIGSTQFWLAVAQSIMIDIVLSGDNAVVIALACRNLPPEQRRKGILWGVAGAITLRIILTAFATVLLDLPFLKLVGGMLLLWIGIKLLLPEDGHGEGEINAADNLWGAIKTIIVADLVMSIDNVLGVAGAAHGNLTLLIFGLLVSIPLIVWSSQLMLKLMDRFPVIVTIGAGLLGWVAGQMMVTDHAVKHWFYSNFSEAGIIMPATGAVLVVVLGQAIAARRLQRGKLNDLAVNLKEPHE